MPSSFDDMLRALEQLVDLTGQNLAETQALRQEIASLRETQAEAGSRAGSGEGPGEGFGSGSPSSPSPLGESGDGLLDAAAGRAGKFGVAAGALGLAAIGAGVGRGAANVAQGGGAADFAGGLAASVNGAVTSIPLVGSALGELTGISGAQRVGQAVAGSQGISNLRQIAVAGGEVDDQLLDQVAGFERQRAQRGEDFDRRVQRLNDRAQTPVTTGAIEDYFRYLTLPGLLGFNVPGAVGEGVRSLHMQINTSGIHTQK